MMYRCPVCGQRGGSPLRTAPPVCCSKRHRATPIMLPECQDSDTLFDYAEQGKREPGSVVAPPGSVQTTRRSRR